jgi:transposase
VASEFRYQGGNGNGYPIGGTAIRVRPYQIGLHRRDRYLNQNGAAARPGSTRRTVGRQNPARSLENHHLVAGLRSTALTAPCVIDGPMNGNGFLAYVEQVLAPTLKPGDVVVLDNLSAHKVPGAREAIEATGANLLYLPPYSPDFNPIEQIFANSKPCYERPLSAPWRPSETASHAFSMPSSQMNALTTSATPDMLQVKWKLI